MLNFIRNENSIFIEFWNDFVKSLKLTGPYVPMLVSQPDQVKFLFWFAGLFFRSFVCSFVRPFVRSSVRSFVRSSVRPSVRPFVRCRT